MREFEGYRRGINLGGWLSQFMRDSREHRETFITESDIEAIAGAGLDHVRLPVDYDVIENADGSVREEGHEFIMRCIGWCRKYGLKMVLDLHKAYGYSFAPDLKEDKTVFFRQEKYRQRFYSTWERLAERYGSYSGMIAFELLNEVVPEEVAGDWNEIALNTLGRIRRLAPDTWVVMGGVMFNSVRAVPLLPSVDDPKFVYTFHCYDPMVFTHQGAQWMQEELKNTRIGYPATLQEYRDASNKISDDFGGDILQERITAGSGPEFFEQIMEDAIRVSEERNIPLYCGEYGVIETADPEDVIRWMRDIHEAFERHDIARAGWTYKRMVFGIFDGRLKDQTGEAVSLL